MFGLLARKKRCWKKLPGSWKAEICQARRGLCWCAMAEKDDCISFQTRQKYMVNFTVELC